MSPRVRQSSERSQKLWSKIPKDYIVWASSLVRLIYRGTGHKLHGYHGYPVIINILSTTGLAIGIHNFPEGLATFVATLSSPSLGVALAIAIALHNIPEGVCVAMPVYYATGSKWRGFLWAFLSGISEPFGESTIAKH